MSATRETLGSLLAASFVSRPNRFVIVAELEDGRRVRAHLPNTGRLTHLTTPGRMFLLRPSTDPARSTAFTATRAWDGCWVALEAGHASALLASWLADHPLPGFGVATLLEREVVLGAHRIDLVAHVGEGSPVWLEVKSGGRAEGDVALLSQTPSTRATHQLRALSDVAQHGGRAAVAFVVQRSDVARLLIGGDADQGWIDAVRRVREAGVAVMAFCCSVTPREVRVERALPISW